MLRCNYVRRVILMRVHVKTGTYTRALADAPTHTYPPTLANIYAHNRTLAHIDYIAKTGNYV